MKRIEFLGAPGVGKSTLYKELKRQRNRKWFTYEEARLHYCKVYRKGRAGSFTDHIKNFLLNIRFVGKWTFPIIEYEFKKKQNEAFWHSKEYYAPLCEMVLKEASLKNGNACRMLIGLELFVVAIKNIVILRDMNDTDIILLDESLLQKVYGLTEWRFGGFEDFVRKYYQHIILPDGLIYCHLEENELLKRVRERGKIIFGHRNLSDQQLYNVIRAQLKISSIGVDILQKRGINILRLDMSQSKKVNTKKVSEFIKSNFT